MITKEKHFLKIREDNNLCIEAFQDSVTISWLVSRFWKSIKTAGLDSCSLAFWSVKNCLCYVTACRFPFRCVLCREHRVFSYLYAISDWWMFCFFFCWYFLSICSSFSIVLETHEICFDVTSKFPFLNLISFHGLINFVLFCFINERSYRWYVMHPGEL